MQQRPLPPAAGFFFYMRQSGENAVAAASAENVGVDIHIVLIGGALIGRLVEKAGARIVARVMTGGADIVDAGVTREIATRLVRSPWRSAASAAERSGIAEPGLMTAAHHTTDAVHQQPAADHAGRSRCRSAQERTAAAHRGLRPAIGLTVGRLA